ncbi:MAG: hypothetical protein ACR2MM_05330 [Flavobacteriaceae bacterium]
MKILLHKVLTLLLCLLCFSCYYDEAVEVIIPEIPENQEVSFASDIQPIFIQDGKDCTTCHNGTVADPDLREGNAYNAIVPDYVVAGNAEASELFQKLPGNNHPIEAGFILNADEIALIKAWIDRGAENN